MARKFSWWLAGIISLMLLLELLFRALPVSTSTETGYHTDPLILTYPPNHRWTVATGWDLRNPQRLQANQQGFVADRNFVRNDQAVALIGDSFIEASMLPAPDRPGSQLERALGGRPVYAMGNPGTALLDYAERIRYAQENFGVRDFVILMERADVRQSLCGSGNVNGPCLDANTLAPRVALLPPPGLVKRIFRHSALAQYLFGQLKFSPQKLLTQAFPSAQKPTSPETPEAEKVPPFVDAVTTGFFNRIKTQVAGKLVIVIDSDRRALAQGQIKPDPARARFIELARAAGAIVVDTQPLFQAHFAQSPLHLEVGPYDGHLNALGVRLVTQAAAKALLQQ